MKEAVYSELTLEKMIRAQFGVAVDVQQAVLHRAPVGPTTFASLFLSNKKQLYLYVLGHSKLTLGDIKKIVSRMGLRAEIYLPPKGRPNYFNEVGEVKFSEVFPGRKNISEEDIAFYKTLATYNPALVLIREVKDGTVYQYDADSNTSWRPAAKFAYRRIRTS